MACDDHFYFVSLFMTSQLDVIFMFPNQRFGEVCWHNAYSSTCTLRISCVITLHINYHRSKLGYWKKIHSTLRRSSSNCKISGCVLKQGSKTHSSLRQSNLQLQNQAALMSRRIRALEDKRCAAGLACTHSGSQDRILLNYTRMENAHTARKKTFVFCYVYR